MKPNNNTIIIYCSQKKAKNSISNIKTYFLKMNLIYGVWLSFKDEICNERPRNNFIKIVFLIHNVHFSIEILAITIKNSGGQDMHNMFEAQKFNSLR